MKRQDSLKFLKLFIFVQLKQIESLTDVSLFLIDSSTISLALSKHRWADFRTTKAGVNLHLRVVRYLP